MTRSFLYQFIRQHRYGVMASVSDGNTPEAAVVGIAADPSLRVVFDTVAASRKYSNLIRNPSIAFVIGWEDERTLQYEGIATIPTGGKLEEIRAIYFEVFPDGRERLEWPGITHFVVEPRWARFSDYNSQPPIIEEMKF
jgi:Pyridoxamine 5'-phosphate oxidase